MENVDVLERNEEYTALRTTLGKLAEGHAGIVVIEGPAGIGKTALLDTAIDTADELDIRVLRASAGEYETAQSFGLVRRLLSPLLDTGPADVFSGPAQYVRGLLSDRPDPTRQPEPEGVFAILHGLYWVLLNLSDDGPIAVVLDDLHWAICLRCAGWPIW